VKNLRPDDNTLVACAGEARSIDDDSTRRDALARSIAVRASLCSVEELLVFDALLIQMEHERDGSLPPDGVLLQLRRDRYNESEGASPTDIAYRKGWTACSRHDEAFARVERGLAELRRQAAFIDERFDHGGES
jgi:hypothetical protein